MVSCKKKRDEKKMRCPMKWETTKGPSTSPRLTIYAFHDRAKRPKRSKVKKKDERARKENRGKNGYESRGRKGEGVVPKITMPRFFKPW